MPPLRPIAPIFRLEALPLIGIVIASTGRWGSPAIAAARQKGKTPVARITGFG